MRKCNYFSDLSESQQTNLYSAIFSVMTIVALLITFCFTFLVDYIGYWLARMVIHLCSIAGNILLILMVRFGNENTNFQYLAFIAIPLFFGSSRAYNAGHSLISKICPERSNFVLSLQYFAMSLSQVIYKIYTDLDQQYLYLIWLALLIVQPFSIGRTIIFLPRYALKKDEVSGEFRLGLETKNDPKIGSKDRSGSEDEPLKVQDCDKTDPTAENTEEPETKNWLAKKFPAFANVMTTTNFLACLIPAIQSVRQFTYIAQLQSILRYEVNQQIIEARNSSSVPFNDSEVSLNYTATEQQFLEKITKEYTQISQYCLMAIIVCLPAQSFVFDLIRKFIQTRNNLTLSKSSVVIGLIEMFYVCCTLFISNFLMLLPGFGVPFIISIFLMTNTSIITYAARYLYIYNTNQPEFHGRLTAFAQLWQILTPICVPLLSYIATHVFKKDWTRQIYLYAKIDLLTVVLLGVLVYVTKKKFFSVSE